MAIEVHVADRTDRLADALADLLAEPLDDPLEQEVVVVPARGVERWLTQRLSHRLGGGTLGSDGVCAGVRFVSPRSLVALLTGTDRTDPWDPDRLVWTVLDAIDASVDQPWCATVARHLGADLDDETERGLRLDRRWSLARRLAGLFASYAVQRPQLVRDWARGPARGKQAESDGAGGLLDGDLLWQPPLWRQVLDRVDAPPPWERHQQTIDAITAGSDLALPQRLSLFGHTRLPVSEIELLRAVGLVRDVHLWVPSPAPVLWEGTATSGGSAQSPPVPRADDATSTDVAHPLLASLGRDSRELQVVLGGLGATVSVADPARHPQTLLGWLQDDITRNRLPDNETRAARRLVDSDHSIQVHAAHGLARQVEVLREVVVGLLEDDPTLEPRDIVVMCPDVDTVAPLVQAAFGMAGVAGLADVTASSGAAPGSATSARWTSGHPAHEVRVSLADRGLASTNPFLALAVHILSIASGRATLTQVLDLAAMPPVRHRFGFDDDELSEVSAWAVTAGARWGLTAELRTPYQLSRFPQNTWQFGLDRLLVGVARQESAGLVGEILPVDDVPSGAVDLAGRIAELVSRLETCVEALVGASALDGWVQSLRDGVRSLGSAPARDAWQVAQFERELAAAVAGAGDGAQTLRLADLRALLASRAAPRPTRASFRTGALTVCTMVPMRSVPHRVVCLVGLDDGVFPRNPSPDGDDALARRPLVGERDARSEDRQLLLDAVLAATERLVVTYSGANEQTGQTRPPAVPLGELLDALEETAGAAAGKRVLVRHPLQPYDERNLGVGRLVPGAVFSFDPAALAGGEAAYGDRQESAPFLTGPLPPLPDERVHEVALDVLRTFFSHPVRAFLRRRLDVAVASEADEPDDAMPVELDGLEKWAVGDRMVRRLVAGDDPETVCTAELRRGHLPPDGLGYGLLRDIVQRAGALEEVARPALGTPARTVDVSVDLGGGRTLVGTVPDVHGACVVRVHYASLSARHRMVTWLDLLALTAAFPATSWSARVVGWQKDRPVVSWLEPPGSDAADILGDLVGLWEQGMREPLPLPLRTGERVARERRDNRNPVRSYRVTDEWQGAMRSPVPGERDDPAHVLVFGDGLSFLKLANWGRRQDGPSPLYDAASLLWEPLLAHELTRRSV